METQGKKVVAGLTVEKLGKVRTKLKETEIKPYKGFVGLGPRGFFEIKSEEDFVRLKALKSHSRKHQYRDCKKKMVWAKND